MPDINFPNSPSGGDTYTYNNITFAYDGEKWTAKGGKAAIGAAVRKKRREDPNKNRKGKAKNVSNTTRKKKKK